MKILTVDVYHWLTFPQLVHLYSVGQMVPGPNMMMIVAIGEWAAGILGAILVVIVFFGPTALLTFFVGRIWNRLDNWPWRSSIQKGLAPVSIGLLLAGCSPLPRAPLLGWKPQRILLQYKINPALLVLGGAIIGALSFGRE